MDNQAAKQQIKSTPLLREAVHESETSPALNSMSLSDALRMGIAAQLLEETDLRLMEIAPRVGYRSEFSFSRAFKLARGVSPIHYRRAAQSRSFHGTLSRKA